MENIQKQYSHRHRRGGLFIGLLLVVAGLLFLCFNAGIIDVRLKWIVFSWQTLLILVGLYNLFFRRHYIFGIGLVLVGKIFLMPKLLEIYPNLITNFTIADFQSMVFPLILILLGALIILAIILRPFRRKHFAQHYGQYQGPHGQQFEYAQKSINGKFDGTAVFGNSEYIVLDPVFLGGDLNAVFGGIRLDLRKTTLAEGVTNLELNAVFGGIVIFVPDSWTLELRFNSVAGGVNDHRANLAERDENRKLVITGSCVMGGIEIKN